MGGGKALPRWGMMQGKKKCSFTKARIGEEGERQSPSSTLNGGYKGIGDR